MHLIKKQTKREKEEVKYFEMLLWPNVRERKGKRFETI